jgi:hypothetical protein
MTTASPLIDDSWCLRCQDIDFDTFLGAYIDPERETQDFPIHDLGTLDQSLENGRCSMCRLLYAVRVPARILDPEDIGKTHPYVLTVVYSPALLDEYQVTRSLFFGVFPKGQTPSRHWIVPDGQQYIIPVADGDDWDYGEFQVGACVETTSLPYDQINYFISTCLDSHPSICHKSVKRPSALQCIDCVSREVVPLPDHATYLALSYVWGKPSTMVATSTSIHNNISIGGVWKHIPPVVQDAIQIILSMNQQYLWVDAFCIDQNNPQTKHEQISRMDQIYEGALLTIIASACSGANDRIHGIGSPRLQKQHQAKNGPLRLVSTLSNMSTEVSSTVWATRGWTYQEAAVSRRCLYLTESQVYFVCPSKSCSEALPHSSLDVGWDQMGSLSTEVRFGHTAPGPELRQLAQHLQEFTRRTLTFSSDNLNAFRGILGRSGFPNYFGIPVAPSDDRATIASIRRSPIKAHIGFARGLYWTPVRSNVKWTVLTRIHEFPSWSWAGWKGAVQYAEAHGPGEWARGGPLMKYDRKFPHIKVWIEDAKGNLEKLDRKLLAAPNKRFLHEVSPFIHVEAQTVQLRLQLGRFDKDTLLVCRCHFDGQHPGHIDDEDLLTTFIPCSSPAANPTISKRLLSEEWTALILFRSYWYEEVYHSMLVFDMQGDFAQRIGAITFRGALPEGLVQTRQRIRIG